MRLLVMLTRSLETAERVKKARWITGHAYGGLATVAMATGDPVEAERCYRESLDRSLEAEDERRVSDVYKRLIVTAVARNDLVQARHMLEKAQEIASSAPGFQEIALGEFNRGLIEERAGNHQAALTAFQQSFLLRHQIGERRGTAKAMEAVARIGAKMGNEKESAMILGAARALRASTKAPFSPAERGRYQDLVTDLRRKYLKEFEEGRQRVLQDVIPIV